MKTNGKGFKVLAFCLILLMAVGLFGTTAFAIASNGTGTITVSGVEDGVTVSAYRLMDVKVNENGQPQEPVYTWVDAAASWVRTNTNYSAYIGTGTDNSVQAAFSTASAENIAAFYDALAAAIKTTNNPLNIPVAGTCTGSGSITNLTMGNYLILIENGMRVYRPSAVNLVPEWKETEWVMSDATIEVKSSEPTITKMVNGKKADNASIGDTVSFVIETDVPQFPASAPAKNYAVSDILPAGLTLTGSIKVSGVTGAESDPLTEGDGNDYTQGSARPNNGGNSAFTLTFDYARISEYEKIRIEYTATLNRSAVLGETGNVNNAYLDYSNNPYTQTSWESKSDSATIYTYGMDISKVDKDDHDTFLAGAEFELYATEEETADKTNAIAFVMLSEGVYCKAAASDTSTTTTLQVGAKDSLTGKLTIKGLSEGTWYLKEITAPDGYNLLASPVKVTIEDKDGDVLDGKVSGAAANATGEAVALVTLTVENDDGFQLPVTGGMGTILFTAVGILLMGAAVILLIFAVRKNRKQS